MSHAKKNGLPKEAVDDATKTYRRAIIQIA